jgi:hypothetical protein
MYMQHNTSHIINRLKHQPRHSDIFDDGKKALADLENLTRIAKLSVDALLNAVDSMDARLSIAGKISRGLDKVIQTNEFLAKSINEINKSMSVLEIRNSAINKTFGVNSISAAKLADSFQKIGKNLGITNDQTNKYAGSIHKLIPTVNQLDKENNTTYQGLIATQHVLQTQLGLSEELANSYSSYATQTGKNAATQIQVADEIAKALDPKGTVGVFNSIVSDIAQTTADVQLQFGRIPGELEVASLKAKQLGFSLAQMAKTGDTLLNIESSIGQELEYQLLSGRRLVGNEKAQANLRGKSLTDAYRQATIAGKASDQADILKTILEQEGDVLSTNLIARRQMSELLGTDEATLSRALQKKKLLEEAGMDGINFTLVGDELMSALKSVNADSEDIAKIMKADEHDTRTTNEIAAQQLQVLQDLKIMMMLEGTDLKNNFAVISALQKSMQDESLKREKNNPFLELKPDELKTLGKTFMSAQIFGKKTQLLSEAKSTAGSTIVNSTQGNGALTTVVEDAIIPPGLGGVISMPAGTVGFQENDGVAIGTNIGTSSSSGNADIMQMATAIVTAIQQQTRALKQGSSFGEGMNTSYFS